jgi:prolipoprotein diacylglyceryltransferase
MAALLPIAWMLFRWRRRGRADRFVLGAYLASTGLVRFAIEFLRVREPVLGPLAVAHLLSFVVFCVGIGLLHSSRRDHRPSAATASQ